ncbi:Hypothetical protein HP17_08134 [Helicobacter pylori NCTC 11637 = CCUG 17874 = ATCC 43504 = JCM 12093]|nr:Hypothetical protein HP17_08134 [Helicobacter pylori NCTC 11637 = CCUG 17874 = ATCC 43504 = JCM 12093]
MLKRPAIKQPLKTALVPILGLVFKIRILNFFITLFLALLY